MQVVAWSFECAATGTFPSCRHDGQPWEKTDAKRKRLACTPLGYKAVLAEVRADWAFMAQVFKFPSHNTKAGCCWRCSVTPETMRDFSLTAAWRQQRLSHWGLLSRWQEWGIEPSPLFSCPYLESSCFGVDWLHAVDQGVAADFLGNLFHHCLPLLPGANKKAKVCALFVRIQEFYRQNPSCSSRYSDLTLLMIKQPKKGPKLRGRAAEVRGLIPFGLALATELLTGSDSTSVTIKNAAQQLMGAYSCLSTASFSPEAFQTNVRQFLLLYCALETNSLNPQLWRCKPKFHLFAELALAGNCPSLQWTYRDEDFGGTAAKVSRRRGGKNSVKSTGVSFLTKFLGKNKLPILRNLRR